MADAAIVNNHQIAVLIDCENTGLHAMQWLFDQLSEMGRIVLKRAYADWSTEGQRRDQVRDLGIEPIQIFHSESGKKSSDIRMAIDASTARRRTDAGFRLSAPVATEATVWSR